MHRGAIEVMLLRLDSEALLLKTSLRNKVSRLPTTPEKSINNGLIIIWYIRFFRCPGLAVQTALLTIHDCICTSLLFFEWVERNCIWGSWCGILFLSLLTPVEGRVALLLADEVAVRPSFVVDFFAFHTKVYFEGGKAVVSSHGKVCSLVQLDKYAVGDYPESIAVAVNIRRKHH